MCVSWHLRPCWWLRIMPQEPPALGTPVVTVLESEEHDIARTMPTSVACTCGHGVLQTETAIEGYVWVHDTNRARGYISVCGSTYHQRQCRFPLTPEPHRFWGGLHWHLGTYWRSGAISGTVAKPQSETLLFCIPPVATTAKRLPRVSAITWVQAAGPIRILEAYTGTWCHGDNMAPRCCCWPHLGPCFWSSWGLCQCLLLMLPQRPLQNICWNMCCSIRALLNWTPRTSLSQGDLLPYHRRPDPELPHPWNKGPWWSGEGRLFQLSKRRDGPPHLGKLTHPSPRPWETWLFRSPHQ